MINEKRKLLAKEPIIWTGDLSDDCTAEWAGLMQGQNGWMMIIGGRLFMTCGRMK
jgi:hypothetical protein